MSEERAYEIAREALGIDWYNTESAARRVAEHAADRIEELEAKQRKLASCLMSANGQAVEAYQAQLEAEAKLAKAAKCIADWVASGCPYCSGDCSGANPPVFSCIMKKTLATLAELKGGE